jgi:hypothetical protein
MFSGGEYNIGGGMVQPWRRGWGKEGSMETRRTFLTGLVLVGAYCGLAGDASRGQTPVIRPPQNPTPEGPPANEAPPMPNPDKKVLETNDKDMKKKVEELYQLAKELKQEVENTDSTKVFSLNLMKKAEEIEKLARDIKNRSKG